MAMRIIAWPMGFILLRKGTSESLPMDRGCCGRRSHRPGPAVNQISRRYSVRQSHSLDSTVAYQPSYIYLRDMSVDLSGLRTIAARRSS